MNREHRENGTPRFRPGDAVGLLLRGVAMGAADVIPGVSGGTIAFITGIYERFIAALRSLSPAPLASLARGRVREAIAGVLAFHWAVLIPLFGGIGLSIVLLSKVITGLMEDEPGPTYAFFFGLILASAWMPLAHMKGFSWRHGLALVIAGGLAWAFVGLQAGPIDLRVSRADAGATMAIYPGKIKNASDLDSVTRALDASAPGVTSVVVFDPNAVLAGVDRAGERPLRRLVTKDEAGEWLDGAPALVVLQERRANLLWILCCGALAISAMILPGVSGSFLLLFLGQYHAVYSSIHECIAHVLGWLGRRPDALAAIAANAWWEDFLFLGTFLVGVLAGMSAFSKIVGWLFARAHDVTMAALTGVMLGALRVPGREVLTGAEIAGGSRGYWGAVTLAAFAGAAVVLGLHFGDRWLRRRSAAGQ